MTSTVDAANAIVQRIYLTCPANWFEPDKLTDFDHLQGQISSHLHFHSDGWSVIGDPTRQWSLRMPDREHTFIHVTEVVQLRFTTDDALKKFLDSLQADTNRESAAAGADLPVATADYWCPIAGNETFSTRVAALQQIRADAIRDLTGRRVNVVIVDRGIDKDDVRPPSRFGGGWAYTPNAPGAMTIMPGSAKGERAKHSGMLIRNIRAIAPEATFFDMPLIPPNIADIPGFLGGAHAAFLQMQADITWMQTQPGLDGPWLLVNAWATFDLRSDVPTGPGRYADNINHPFHVAVSGLTNDRRDIVFCAGNCGQWCPDDRCGPGDIGFGRSISGANAYPEVLSVGAVRVDGLPLGYSSQGPGMIAPYKPDLCAPSNFADDHDPGRINGGTSAACAVAAGVLAALRTKSTVTTPATLVAVLHKGAGRPAYDHQLGFGIIDAAATRKILGI